MRKLSLTLLISIFALSAFAGDYRTYESCMFDQMKRQQTEAAAKAIEKLCKTLPTKKELEQKKNDEGKVNKTKTKKSKTSNTNNGQTEYITTYFEFPGTFTTNLKDSRYFLQLGIGVSTQYDEVVMLNVEANQLQIRSAILTTMSNFSLEDIRSTAGREKLASDILSAINFVQSEKFGFGGLENVHFTSFIIN